MKNGRKKNLAHSGRWTVSVFRCYTFFFLCRSCRILKVWVLAFWKRYLALLMLFNLTLKVRAFWLHLFIYLTTGTNINVITDCIHYLNLNQTELKLVRWWIQIKEIRFNEVKSHGKYMLWCGYSQILLFLIMDVIP